MTNEIDKINETDQTKETKTNRVNVWRKRQKAIGWRAYTTLLPIEVKKQVQNYTLYLMKDYRSKNC